MKKIILLFVALVSLSAMISCSNDDDSNSGSLEGKWEFSKYGYSLAGQEFLFDYEHTSGCTKDYIVFTSNTTSNHTFSDDGSGCIEDIDNATYTRNGNVLTSNNDETIEIASISDTTLKFKLLYEGEDEDIPDGAAALIVLKRIN